MFFNKNKKGISLIALVITILVMIILAAIVINIGINQNIDNTLKAKLAQEFAEVKEVVTQRGKEYKLDAKLYNYDTPEIRVRAFSGMPGTSGDNTITINGITYSDGYFEVDPKGFEALGLTGVTHTYIVNFETGDAILKEPVTIGYARIYTLDDIMNETTGGSILGKEEYDEVKGVNKPILFTGMVPVKLSGSTWVVTTVDDNEWYDYTINGNGPVRYANVMLMDGLTLQDGGRNYTNEEVRGMKIESLDGMTVTSKGSMFIWIPRFTYKGSEIVYSKLFSDYTANGYIKSPAFYRGPYTGAVDANEDNTGYVAGGQELTGFWISKYQAGYAN